MKKKLLHLLYSLLFFLPATVSAQIANHVVMSQVYGGGGNTGAPWTNDFVELYNPTAADITMTNWSLQYTSAAGTTWGSGTTIATFSGTIKAHGYFLIGLAAGATVTNKPLPATDATGGINMSASAGKVALVNSATLLTQVANPTDASIVDLIGFYTAGGATVTNGYETAVLTVPSTITSNTWAAQRVANASSTAATLAPGGSDASAGNGWDSNNNSTDFVPQTNIVPKNSATPIAPAFPSLTTTTTTLNFGNQTINVASSPALTYTLNGANLTANTTVTATGPFLVSKTATGGFATSITFNNTTDFTTPPTVYVQFTPTALGAATGSITNTSTGVATGPTISLTGTGVVPTPILTPSVTTLSFGTQTINTTSSPALSYTLTGANLTVNSTITVTGPFLISKTATGGFGTSLTFNSTSDFTTPPTIYVQFTPAVLGAATGSISHSTTGAASTPTVSLTGTGVVPNPALANSTPTLTFNTTVNTTSPSQTYTLTGSNLTAGVTLTTAAPYGISKDGITFSTTLTYLSTDFSSNQTVYVQFKPTATGAANGTISETSTNATTQTVTLNGTGIAVPVLTATPSTIAFGNQSITATSTAQTFTLTGANVTVATTVTTAAPFAVSKDGITYSTSLSYSTTEIAAGPKVYVDFAPTTIAPFVGSVSIATTGAVTQTVALTGAGITPPNVAPTLNAIADQTVCYTSTPQNIALSNITPGPEATQSVVVSVSSNNAALFAQLGVFTISGTTTGTLSYTIANNASGTAAVTVTVKDNGGTVNGGVDTYTRTFNITVNALSTTGITSDIGNTITLGSTAHLTAAAGATTYAWTGTDIVSGQTTAVLTVRPKATTTYTLVETNAAGCSTTQTFVVTVNTFSPLVTNNILTPDGDGKNDTWIVHNIDFYPTSTVKVVDKAGKVVFSKTNYLNDWDGTYNGQPLTQGTYYYVIDLGTGAPKYTGFITLIRK